MFSLTIATFCILFASVLLSPRHAIVRFLKTGSLSKSEEVECMCFILGIVVLFVGVSLLKHAS